MILASQTCRIVTYVVGIDPFTVGVYECSIYRSPADSYSTNLA